LIHLSGTVRLHAVIGTDGRVRELEVLSGNPIFVPSAMAAVRQWRYQPTRLSGEAVEVETYITVEFVLR
jgi:protein TonB